MTVRSVADRRLNRRNMGEKTRFAIHDTANDRAGGVTRIWIFLDFPVPTRLGNKKGGGEPPPSCVARDNSSSEAKGSLHFDRAATECGLRLAELRIGAVLSSDFRAVAVEAKRTQVQFVEYVECVYLHLDASILP